MIQQIKDLFKENKILLTKRERQIVKEYVSGYKELDKEIARIYKKYAKKDGKLYMEDMVKYDRINKLERDVSYIIAKIYKANNKLTRATLRDIMTRSYKAITDEAKVKAIIKQVKVTEEVNKLVAGINWKDRNANHQINLIYSSHGIIKKGLEEGKTYNTMAKELRDLLGKDIDKPIRIIRTESHRIMESGKLEAVKDLDAKGIKMTKTWVTMGDERVRSSHQGMDGVTVGIDEEFTLPGGVKTQAPGLSGDPSEDINCRCILTYDIKPAA